MSKLLVVGCQGGSLGEAVVLAADVAGFEVATAGISGEEYSLNLMTVPMQRFRNVLRGFQPDHVVCTVGINQPEEAGKDPWFWYSNHFATNVVGPMRLLQEFSAWVTEDVKAPGKIQHFVAISSNSATIPRTQSAAYCASKAALSQALRVKAREASGGDHGYIVYGYEPGWLADTPMSHGIESRFGSGSVMHRMRGKALASGVNAHSLATQIVAGLKVLGAGLNGALIRYDGGEL